MLAIKARYLMLLIGLERFQFDCGQFSTVSSQWAAGWLLVNKLSFFQDGWTMLVFFQHACINNCIDILNNLSVNLEIICLQKYWLRPVDLTPFTLLTGCDKFIYSGMKDGDVHLVDRPFGGLVVLQSRLLSILLWTMATVLITGYRVSLSNISERNLFFLMCIYHV